MSIKTHFQAETLDATGVYLDENQEEELSEFLDELIQLQASVDSSESFEERIKNLAGLAFVAGRSYQKEIDGYEELGEESVQQEEGRVYLSISTQAAARLIAYLLGEE